MKSSTKPLESRIRDAARELAAAQVARLWKIPTDLRLTRHGVAFGECGPCDFYGFDSHGRAILLEAKHVNRARLPLGKSPGLTANQWRALREAARAGAHSLVVWQRGDELAVVTAEEVEAARGRYRSVPWNGISSGTNLLQLVRSRLEARCPRGTPR